MKKLIYLFAGISLWSCGQPEQKDTVIQPSEPEAAIQDMHNSQNAIEYLGTYYGILPCADCEGIETYITLSMGDTYLIKTTYLGKGNNNSIEKRGLFHWDASGGIAIFDGLDHPNQYRIGENRLIQLDANGIEITGELAEKYVLVKQ